MLSYMQILYNSVIWLTAFACSAPPLAHLIPSSSPLGGLELAVYGEMGRLP